MVHGAVDSIIEENKIFNIKPSNIKSFVRIHIIPNLSVYRIYTIALVHTKNLWMQVCILEWYTCTCAPVMYHYVRQNTGATIYYID